MSNKLKVEIERPTPILKKSIKLNLKELTKSLAKGGINLFTANWTDLSENALDAAASLGLGKKAEEIAWLLIYSALKNAIKSLIIEEIREADSKFDLDLLNKTLEDALENYDISLNKTFFNKPDKDAFISTITIPFKNWLVHSSFSEKNSEIICERLPIYFTYALHEEWSSKPSLYAILKEQLDTPFTAANERTQGWAKYRSWLRKQVELPLFLEVFSLKQVYVPLRGYFIDKKDRTVQVSESEGAFLETKSRRVVIDLEKHVYTWLRKADKDDAIRLISGNPGSGKSSFVKMLAASIAEKQAIPVLFIPLHHFEPSEDLIDAVIRYLQEDGFISHNPILGDHREERLIIIFDGLDELAMQGKVAERTAQDFIREINRKVERLNQQKVFLQVIISGRELVIQANESSFRKEGQILHVLPYYIPEHEHQLYYDHAKLLEDDQRDQWWRKYGNATNQPYTSLPKQIDIEGLNEITSQPLLNYLIALSLKRGNIEINANTNLNAIYADLLKSIYERGWAGHQHASINGIEEKDFIRILEEIAMASWHGNGRTTTVNEIENHCSSSGLKTLLEKFKTGMESDTSYKVTQLLTAFYFRQSGTNSTGENTFEFTHKSFGEYLTAKRIVREVKLINKKLCERRSDPDDGWDERDALHKWAVTFGPSNLDAYIFKFLIDELRFINLEADVDIESYQKDLGHLISFIMKHGMPIDRIIPRPSFHEESKLSKNAEEALLIVLNACAITTKLTTDIDWPRSGSFGTWISNICGQREKWENIFALSHLSFLNIEGCNLNGSDLWRSNFADANITKASFVSSDCRYSNFQNTVGIKSNFAYSNLTGSVFNGANLKEAYLEGCRIFNTNFNNANLRDANFRNAVIVSANFSGADLEGANFEGSLIQNVKFKNANLTNTVFHRANIENTKLPGIDFEAQKITTTSLSLESDHFEPDDEDDDIDGEF